MKRAKQFTVISRFITLAKNHQPYLEQKVIWNNVIIVHLKRFYRKQQLNELVGISTFSTTKPFHNFIT